MPIGSFADTSSVEKETIVLSRALLEIEEINLHYGDDPENPAPYEVKSKDGDTLFTADPNISALITVVDDYADGDCDGKKFWDKFYLKLNKTTGCWEAGENSKLGMAIKAHPKYGRNHFNAPNPKPFDENDLVSLRFESATEQKEDRSGKKLEGTRVNWLSIGAVPKRDKKKAKQVPEQTLEQTEQENAEALSEADAAAMNAAIT
jgi:hypothetical protein